MVDDAHPTPTGHPAVHGRNARPGGVTVLAVVFALFGFLTFIGGISVLFLAITPAFTLGVGAFYVLVGIAEIAVAVGLWKGLRWAWFSAVVLEVIAVITGIVSLIQGELLSGVVSLLVAGIIVWYLLKPEVQGFFGVRYSTPWGGSRPA